MKKLRVIVNGLWLPVPDDHFFAHDKVVKDGQWVIITLDDGKKIHVPMVQVKYIEEIN